MTCHFVIPAIFYENLRNEDAFLAFYAKKLNPAIHS